MIILLHFLRKAIWSVRKFSVRLTLKLNRKTSKLTISTIKAAFREGGDFICWPLPESGARLVMFSSGLGDAREEGLDKIASLFDGVAKVEKELAQFLVFGNRLWLKIPIFIGKKSSKNAVRMSNGLTSVGIGLCRKQSKT